MKHSRSIAENFRDGYAHPLVSAWRFRVWLCPKWFFGYECSHGHFMLFVIPCLGIGWTR